MDSDSAAYHRSQMEHHRTELRNCKPEYAEDHGYWVKYHKHQLHKLSR